MKAIGQFISSLIIVICLGIGLYFVYQSLDKKSAATNQPSISESKESAAVRKYLAQFGNRPQRIEIETLTERLKSSVDEIKKMKMPLDPKGTYYVRIQFFTDEADPKAPLISQFRFFDLASDNLIREESINIDAN